VLALYAGVRNEPDPEVKALMAFLALLENDEYGCFYG
jgi:hypothetical protein